MARDSRETARDNIGMITFLATFSDIVPEDIDANRLIETKIREVLEPQDTASKDPTSAQQTIVSFEYEMATQAVAKAENAIREAMTQLVDAQFELDSQNLWLDDEKEKDFFDRNWWKIVLKTNPLARDLTKATETAKGDLALKKRTLEQKKELTLIPKEEKNLSEYSRTNTCNE